MLVSMALSSETEWIIVVSGLIAHADGVLDGEECDRLLGVLDEEEVDGETYSEWLSIVGDAELLQQKLESLPKPADERHRDLLEQAWQMAMVDGERCDAEVDALNRIAGRLGVPSVQLDFWREAWTQNERSFSEQAARAATAVLGGGAPPVVDDRQLVSALIDLLPTTNDHREELRATAVTTQDLDEMARALNSATRKVRVRLLRLLAPLVLESAAEDAARERYFALATGAGVARATAEQLLAKAHV